MILASEPAGSGLHGEITPPGDKSISHRALIFSSLAAGRSELSGLLESEDTLATLRACEQLGAVVERGPESIFVTGTGGSFKPPSNGLLDMGNSGTAMRLLAGILSGQNLSYSGNAHFPFISTDYKKMEPRTFNDLNWFGFSYYNYGFYPFIMPKQSYQDPTVVF